MLKVVIADDEYYFRKALINNIEWEGNGFVIVGDANNGKTAYEMISKEQPDIAVLDINMPELNGLELIDKLNADGMECKYVLLSGYDEFRRLLSQGVFARDQRLFTWNQRLAP